MHLDPPTQTAPHSQPPQGYIDNYEGWRVSFKGRRFRIERATLFNVEAPSGATSLTCLPPLVCSSLVSLLFISSSLFSPLHCWSPLLSFCSRGRLVSCGQLCSRAWQCSKNVGVPACGASFPCCCSAVCAPNPLQAVHTLRGRSMHLTQNNLLFSPEALQGRSWSGLRDPGVGVLNLTNPERLQGRSGARPA